MIYFELGRTPLYVDRYAKMIMYWLKLLNSDNCILKYIYEDMYESSVIKPNNKLNWACKIRDLLYKYGFQDVWISQGVVNTELFIN